LRRAATHDHPWIVSPAEAGALVAEMERLREEVERLQQDAVIARSAETSLTVEVEQLRVERARTSHMRSSLGTALMLEREKERAAVVTYLLAPGTSCDNCTLAEAIGRGDHITEGTP
jgi:FtsZ-binding cell division protein ZapB